MLKKDLLKTVSTSAKNTHTYIMDANTHFELRLHYKHNTSTVVKDSITHAYSIRLWVDHKIETWQPNDSTLVSIINIKSGVFFISEIPPSDL